MRASDTATLPYPTHQAISTPSSSRHRGDWGLKRPLPDRRIPKSNAHLRVKAIDNMYHITDFASAADHTQTVAKWQDLNLPMSLPQSRDTMSGSAVAGSINVFEDAVDHTAFTAASVRELDAALVSAERAMQRRSLPDEDQTKRRWKTDGPWVNGLTEDQFQQYLHKTVRKHKAGFLRFLEQVRIGQKKQQIMLSLRDEGLVREQDAEVLELELEKQSKLDEHELTDFIKTLRENNNNLSSELSGLIREFFDLPAFPTADEKSPAERTFARSLQVYSSSATQTPPSTHPSAGLSYLRTAAYMDNHPAYGPQEVHPPVQARVLRPRSTIGIGAVNSRAAVIGVAGFVTSEPGRGGLNFRPGSGRDGSPGEQEYSAAVTSLDPYLEGGNKLFVQPNRAHVDERGYIQLSVAKASEQAIGVKTGNPRATTAPDTGSTNRTTLSFGFKDNGRPSRAGNSRGFDDAEVREAQGQADPLQAIRNLAQLHESKSRKD